MFSSLVDIIFPRKCVTCGALGRYICVACIKLMPGIPLQPGWCSLVEYRGLFEKVFKMAKYGMYEAVLRDLTEGLLEANQEKINTFCTDVGGVICIPVPLHKARQRERGFNQSELIAQLLGKITKLSVDATCVTRAINTPRLAGMGRVERGHQIAGAFNVVSPVPKRCVIVDDVCTTGATLQELSKTLRAHGADHISLFTLARRWYTKEARI